MSMTPTAGRHAPEQFRPLRHAGADEQTAVAAPLDGQFVGARVTLLNQVLGCGDE